MLSWCAYCQQFQGEIPPFESPEISHGMCEACAATGLDGSDGWFDQTMKLKEIQGQLARAGRAGDRGQIERIVDAAMAARVRPIDVLIGLTAPLLAELGRAWEEGTLCLADEKRFTSFCEDAFAIVDSKVRAELSTEIAHETNAHAEIVVVNAPGNRHTFGIRVLALWLLSRGRVAKMIPPQASTAQLVDAIAAATPRLVAISVALPEHRPGAVALVEQLVARGLLAELVVGGNAVKQGMVAEIAGASLVVDISAL